MKILYFIFLFSFGLQAAVIYESNLSVTHSATIDENKVLKIFNESNELILNKKIDATDILFHGMDNDARYYIVQTQEKYFVYDLKKKSFKSYTSHLKEPLTTFTVQSEKNLLVGTESGRVLKAKIKSNGVKVYDYLDYKRRMPVKEIKFSQFKERFYVLHQKFNYDQIGFKFKNYLISEQQKVTPSIGFKPQNSGPSGWNKTSVGFTNSYPVGDFDLLQAQAKNAKAKAQSYTQQLSVYNRTAGGYQKIFAAEEISSFAFDMRMKNLYGSFNIDNKVISYDLMKIIEGKGKEGIKEITNSHKHFLKVQNGNLLLANADSKELQLINQKDPSKIKKIKFSSNIRAIHQVENAVYIIEESGKVHLGAMDQGEIKIQKFLEIDSELARDIQIKPHKSYVSITDINGRRKRVFLPRGCGGIFKR